MRDHKSDLQICLNSFFLTSYRRNKGGALSVKPPRADGKPKSYFCAQTIVTELLRLVRASRPADRVRSKFFDTGKTKAERLTSLRERYGSARKLRAEILKS
jgi:hypothetical protein